MKRFATIFLLSAALFAARASGADCPACAEPSVDDKTVVIDARSGDISGKREFSKKDDVRVLLKNKNPFKYDYRVTQECKVVAEPGLEAFMAFLKVPSLEVPAERSGDGLTLKSGGCTIPKDISEAGTVLLRLRTDLRADFAKAKEGLGAVAKEVEVHRKVLQNDFARPEQLFEAGTSIANAVGGLKALPKPAALQALNDAMQGAATAQKYRIAEYVRANPACASAVGAPAANADDYSGPVAASYKTQIDEYDKAVKALLELTERIETILARPDAFHASFALKDCGFPRNIDVVAQRRLTGTEHDWSEIAARTINVGGRQRFTLAIGAAFAALDDVKYERQQGYAINRDGTLVDADDPALTNVVGLERDSDSRVTPLLLLHGRLRDWDNSALQLSLGISSKLQDGGTEFLLGPSLSLFEDRLFLTAGAYYGIEQHLAGNLWVGGAIPDSLTEIPTVEERKWSVAIGATYRVK